MNNLWRYVQCIMLVFFSMCTTYVTAQPFPYRLHYDPADGVFSLEVGENIPLTTLEIKSIASVFTGPRPIGVFDGLFDVYGGNKLFKLDPNGFGDIQFGPVVTPGFSFDFLASDLCAIGSKVVGGGIGGLVGLAGLEGDVSLTGCPIPAGLNFRYDSGTGEFSLDVTGQPQRFLSTVLVNSESSLFVDSVVPESLSGQFDILRPDRLFKLDPAGFEDTSFGSVLPTGFQITELLNDLCVAGSYQEGGQISGLTLNGERLRNCNRPGGDVIVDPDFPRDDFLLIYDPFDGGLQLATPRDNSVTTLEVKSASSLFTGERPAILADLFDVFNPEKLFKLDPNGFGNVDFGSVLPTGLANQELVSDFSIASSLLGGGLVEIRIVGGAGQIPEPTSGLCVMIGVVALFAIRKRSRKS